MTSRWTLAAVQQLFVALVMFLLRELDEHRSNGPPPAELTRFMVVMWALSPWFYGSLGSVLWWLVTGRGPGGRLVAASSVTPRPYRFGR